MSLTADEQLVIESAFGDTGALDSLTAYSRDAANACLVDALNVVFVSTAIRTLCQRELGHQHDIPIVDSELHPPEGIPSQWQIWGVLCHHGYPEHYALLRSMTGSIDYNAESHLFLRQAGLGRSVEKRQRSLNDLPCEDRLIAGVSEVALRNVFGISAKALSGLSTGIFSKIEHAALAFCVPSAETSICFLYSYLASRKQSTHP